jgi:hypothetical protein
MIAGAEEARDGQNERSNETVWWHTMTVPIICDLVGGQFSLKKLIDNGKLTVFIIRYGLVANL